MAEIHIFNLIPPKSLPTEEELQQMTHPLNFCTECGYVLCSCGNCHNSELCNEMCLYDTTDDPIDE